MAQGVRSRQSLRTPPRLPLGLLRRAVPEERVGHKEFRTTTANPDERVLTVPAEVFLLCLAGLSAVEAGVARTATLLAARVSMAEVMGQRSQRAHRLNPPQVRLFLVVGEVQVVRTATAVLDLSTERVLLGAQEL